MTTGLQRARMAAVRAALASLRAHRHRQFTLGYGLVVSGGACTPGAGYDTLTVTSYSRVYDCHLSEP